MHNDNRCQEVIIDVTDLRVEFEVRGRKPFVAVKDVSFKVYEGETFGLVGETGSGKTTIGRAIIRINQTAGGVIKFRGEQINGVIPKERDRMVTQKIQMIFQDPMASLNERASRLYRLRESLQH